MSSRVLRSAGVRGALGDAQGAGPSPLPRGIFLPPDFTAYQAHSNRFREVLLSLTPLVEPISLDEAFLDVGGATWLFGRPTDDRARDPARRGTRGGRHLLGGRRVHQVRGQARLGRVQARRHAGRAGRRRDGLPRAAAGGPAVGRGGEDRRDPRAAGVRTIGDLGRTPETILARLLGEQNARHLSQLAHGVDERVVVPYEAPKSVGHEETFERDLDDERDDPARAPGALGPRGVASASRRLPGPHGHPEGPPRHLHDAHAARGRCPTPPTWAPTSTASVGELYRALPGERRRIRLLGVQATGLVRAAPSSWRCSAGERWSRRRARGRPHRGAGSGAVRPSRRRCWTVTVVAERHDPRTRPSASARRAPPYNREDTSPPETDGPMPLSDHEQRILEEIERRLAEDDPKLVEQVGRTDLYTHLARRIRLAALAFIVGCVLLLLFVVSPWIAAVGLRADGAVGADDLPLPRAARARSDPRDAAGRPLLDDRAHRPDRGALPPAAPAADPDDASPTRPTFTR